MTFKNQTLEKPVQPHDAIMEFLKKCEYFYPEFDNKASENSHFLEEFVNPKSIAFFGANGNLLTNIASQQLINLYDNGYKGKIYPIHPKLEKVFGYKAYKNVLDLPEIPDLAMIVVNKKFVPQILEELHQKGTKNVILVTAGFRETGNAESEQNIKEIADKYGIRFFGPNCIGMLNTHCHSSEEDHNYTSIFNCTSINYHGTDKTSQEYRRPGNVSIISHSGTFASHIFMDAQKHVLDMSKSFSLGNEANIDMVECLEYLENDSTTDVILLYIEEIKRGREFVETCKRITAKKPILAIYVGGSEAGARAVASHTGSMAGNDRVFNGVFNQTGIIRVYSIEEMMDAALLLSKMIPIGAVPEGKRLVISTTSGGPGATLSDRASRLNIHMPQFSIKLGERISKHLLEIANCVNPLDFTFNLNAGVYYRAIPRLLGMSGEFDAMISYGAFGPKYFTYSSVGKGFVNSEQNQKAKLAYFQILRDNIESARRIMQRYHFPMIYINPLGDKDEFFVYLNKQGFPTYSASHRAINALDKLFRYAEYLQKTGKIELFKSIRNI